jgi:transcriptional regulator with XRE-family HTH domain
MTDGEKLKKIRTALKLTQVEFADALNVAQATISTLEKKGTSEVPTSILKQLVKKWGVNPYYFLLESPQTEFMPVASTREKQLEKKIKEYEALIAKLNTIMTGK